MLSSPEPSAESGWFLGALQHHPGSHGHVIPRNAGDHLQRVEGALWNYPLVI